MEIVQPCWFHCLALFMEGISSYLQSHPPADTMVKNPFLFFLWAPHRYWQAAVRSSWSFVVLRLNTLQPVCTRPVFQPPDHWWSSFLLFPRSLLYWGLKTRHSNYMWQRENCFPWLLALLQVVLPGILFKLCATRAHWEVDRTQICFFLV